MPVLFNYQNMCITLKNPIITLKIQLLHSKSDFITLDSGGGLAGLPRVRVSGPLLIPSTTEVTEGHFNTDLLDRMN